MEQPDVDTIDEMLLDVVEANTELDAAKDSSGGVGAVGNKGVGHGARKEAHG